MPSIPHQSSAPDGGYWLKLPPGQTAQGFPLGLLYDAPAAKRPIFAGSRVIEFCMQTSDNSKAFIIAWSGQTAVTGYPASMTPVPYEIYPVFLDGVNAVRLTTPASTTFPGHYERLDNADSLDGNSVRLWATYDMDVVDTLVGGSVVPPNSLGVGGGQPVGGRIVFREHSGFLGTISKDNAYRWDGTHWVLDLTLNTWSSGPPPPITGLVYQVAITRTITYVSDNAPPTVSDEQFHGYNPDGTQIPGAGVDYFGEGYVNVVGPSLDRGTLSVMIDTADDDFTKVDLVAKTDLIYGPTAGSQVGDVCPIGGSSHAVYAAMAADGVTLHYGLLGPPQPTIKVKPGPRRLSFEP